MEEEKEKWLREVLSNHHQWFQTSCAASAMEIVLKFEKKIGLDEYPLQEKYGGQNIGFEKLQELQNNGIQAIAHKADLDILKGQIKSKSKDNKIILISAPTLLAFSLTNRNESFHTSHHIFVGLQPSARCAFEVLSKSHMKNEMLRIHNMDKLYHSVRKADRKFLFDYVSY